jgi:hypothetical protein
LTPNACPDPEIMARYPPPESARATTGVRGGAGRRERAARRDDHAAERRGERVERYEVSSVPREVAGRSHVMLGGQVTL